METIRTFQAAVQRFNENSSDADARSALATASQGLRVLVRGPNGLIDIEESSQILAFAIETGQAGEEGALTAEQLFAELLPRIEADPITGAPLRKGKTTQRPLIDWSRVPMHLRRLAAYAAEKRDPAADNAELAAHALSGGAPTDAPPWSRLARELAELEGKKVKSLDEEKLLLRVGQRLYFQSGQESPSSSVTSTAGELSPTMGRPALRAAIHQKLRTDSDLTGFLLDFFPKAYRQMSGGMVRDAKINLLLDYYSVAEIAQALKEV